MYWNAIMSLLHSEFLENKGKRERRRKTNPIDLNTGCSAHLLRKMRVSRPPVVWNIALVKIRGWIAYMRGKWNEIFFRSKNIPDVLYNIKLREERYYGTPAKVGKIIWQFSNINNFCIKLFAGKSFREN